MPDLIDEWLRKRGEVRPPDPPTGDLVSRWMAKRALTPAPRPVVPGLGAEDRLAARRAASEIEALEARAGRRMSPGARLAAVDMERRRAGLESLTDPDPAATARRRANEGSAARAFAAGVGGNLSAFGADIVGLVDPDMAARMVVRAEAYYGPHVGGVAGTAGTLIGEAAKSIALLPGGLPAFAGAYGAAGAGGVRRETAERRAAGQEIGGLQEAAAAAGVGATEALSGLIGAKLFQRAGKALEGLIPGTRTALYSGGRGAAARYVADRLPKVLGTSLSEATQEYVTQVADNVIMVAAGIDPDRNVQEGAGEAAITGALLAPLLGPIMRARFREKQRKADIAAEAKTTIRRPPGTPSAKIRAEAAEYLTNAKMAAPTTVDYTPVDPRLGSAIADAYAQMAHAPTDPLVRRAYADFKEETKKQYDFLVAKGVRFEFGADPYASSDEMRLDVATNNRLKVFKTLPGQIPSDHPLAEVDPATGLMYNDLFRAVHDYFGHTKDGNGFGARGEDHAWKVHSMMYSERARLAMTTETRGQNSWVNFGPFGKKNQADPANTVYPPQKAGLLPPQYARPSGKLPTEIAGDTGRPFRVTPEVLASSTPAKLPTLAKLTDAIKRVKPIRAQYERVKSEELSRRAAAIRKVDAALRGREGAVRAAAKLKGKLPPPRQVEPLNKILTEEEINELLDHMQNHILLSDSPIDRAALRLRFMNLVDHGTLPTTGEIRDFGRIFGPEFMAGLIGKGRPWREVANTLADIINIPKTLRSSFDLSATFRQGFNLTITHPVSAARAFVDQIRAMASEPYALALDAQMRADPDYDLAIQSKLFLPHPTDESTLANREEAFMSRLAREVPGVAASQRAFVTYLNQIRWRAWKAWTAHMATKGVLPKENPDSFKYLARTLNAMTGRGNVTLGSFTAYANAGIWSPRLLFSRFEYPVRAVGQLTRPELRAFAIRQYIAHFALLATTYGLLKVAAEAFDWPLTFVTNPEDRDFMRVRFDDGTSIDMSGGYGQYGRTMARLWTNHRYDPVTERRIKGSPQSTIGFFATGKAAPVPSVLISLSQGERYPDKPIRWSPALDEGDVGIVGDLFAPIALENLVEFNHQHGAMGNLLLLPETLGLSVQTPSEDNR